MKVAQEKDDSRILVVFFRVINYACPNFLDNVTFINVNVSNIKANV